MEKSKSKTVPEMLDFMIAQAKEFGAASYEMSGTLKDGHGFSIKVHTPDEWKRLQKAKDEAEDDYDDED